MGIYRLLLSGVLGRKPENGAIVTKCGYYGINY